MVDQTTPSRPLQVSILLFDSCDLLDSGGPYEVFLTASRLAERNGDQRPFDVHTVTTDDQPVTAYGGLGLTPSASAEVLATSDVVIVPGAVDLDAMLGNSAVLDAVKAAVGRTASTDGVVASVCTGAFLLGEASALDGHNWTTHWEDIGPLADRVGQDGASSGVRWVDSGSIVTAGGLSSGIAMALHLVARFAGEDLASQTARQIDYDWTNTSLVT